MAKTKTIKVIVLTNKQVLISEIEEAPAAVPGEPDCRFVKKDETVMVDPRTEAVKAIIDKVEYLLVGEHQLLGKW